MRCALRELPCPLHPADDQVGHPSGVDLLTLAQALALQKAALPNIHQNFVPIPKSAQRLDIGSNRPGISYPPNLNLPTAQPSRFTANSHRTAGWRAPSLSSHCPPQMQRQRSSSG